MPETTTQDSLLGKVQFIQNHRPVLQQGEYKVSVTQNLTLPDVNPSFSSNLTFVVTGDPFELNPQDIHTVFPPAGSSGDHAHVLPHIVLKRSTLPWEMKAQKIETQEEKEKPAPWLALLVIHEEETQGENPSVLPIKILVLGDLKKTKEKDTKKFSILGVEYDDEDEFKALTGHQLDKKVTILDIKRELLQALLPSLDDLRYLAHVRQTSWNIIDNSSVYSIICEDNKLKFAINNKDDESKDRDFKDRLSELKSIIDALTRGIIPEMIKVHLKLSEQAFLLPSEALATIIANRLPKRDGTSTVYLVSLHNRFDDDKFNYQTEDDNSYIRFITLKSWSFSCQDSGPDFLGLLKKLEIDTLKLPTPKNQNKSEQDKNDEEKRIANDANQYLNKGYIPLPHSLRQGGKTFSWYHSPLIPAKNTSSSSLAEIPIRCPDQLIAYNEQYGLFDISYAAAWQLGQLLALQDQKFALELFNWKRAKALESKQKTQMSNSQAHLVSIAQSIDVELPETVATWLEQLRLLKNVPFNYLVPDDKMLLQESIRFFWLDWFWVESLLDGAFSIGRVQESDVKSDLNNNPSIKFKMIRLLFNSENIIAIIVAFVLIIRPITGFLLRSEVVAGWPDLQIEGLDDKKNKLKLLRGDRLSTDVMICLFEGEIQQVDISLKPEGLHFGFDANKNNKNQLHLELRDQEGNLLTGDENTIQMNEKFYKNRDIEKRVINIQELSSTINNKVPAKDGNFTSEDLALQLIQGAAKVHFELQY